MIDGLNGHQQRTIARMARNGHTLDAIADHYGVTVDTVKTVVAHRESLDDKRGVIRLGAKD